MFFDDRRSCPKCDSLIEEGPELPFSDKYLWSCRCGYEFYDVKPEQKRIERNKNIDKEIDAIRYLNSLGYKVYKKER